MQVQQQIVIVYPAIDNFRTKLGNFKMMVDATLEGRVTPIMTPPPLLRHILNDVQRSNLELLFLPTELLDQYYRLLKCSVVPVESGLLAITTVFMKKFWGSSDKCPMDSYLLLYK